jgi:hypothetical protein
MGRDSGFIAFLPDSLCQHVLLLWRFHAAFGHNYLFVWWKQGESFVT